MKNKLFIMLLILITIFTFTSCDSSNPSINADGSMVELTLDEMKAEGRTGFYIMSEEKIFSPVMNRASGYQGDNALDKETTKERYLWFHDNDVKNSKLIPTIKKGDKLVFMYDTDRDIPSTFTLEKYNFKGYTIGCHLYKASDNSLYLSLDSMLTDSNAQKQLKEYSNDLYKISTINKSSKLPVDNVDNSMQILLGLEKNKSYSFEFYKGTKYLSIETIADTFIFQSSSITELKNPYKRTKEGYFVVNLPENLKDGYYYICGEGLFKYEN